MSADELPWAGLWPWSPRCRAVHEPEPGPDWRTQHFGRCELAPHSPAIDHALDRGMDIPRWSTRWTS